MWTKNKEISRSCLVRTFRIGKMLLVSFVPSLGVVACHFDSDSDSEPVLLNVAPALTEMQGVISVKAGTYHSCALLETNEVKCWGRNQFGQLGNPTLDVSENSGLSVYVHLNEMNQHISDSIEIAAGGNHSCMRTAANQVRCWGRNAFGQLGNGTTEDSNLPQFVAPLGSDPLSDIASMELGSHHSCFLHSSGLLSCSGQWSYGQLGNALGFDVAAPITVRGFTGEGVLENNAEISLGHLHSCSVRNIATDVSEAWCWGDNREGQSGVFYGDQQNFPVPVTEDEQRHLTGVMSISAGREHSCVVMADSTARCWGSNEFGQLGSRVMEGGGQFGFAHRVRATMDGAPLTGIVEIAAGDYHTCARMSDATVKCWGQNERGQLGIGSTDQSTVPQTVSSLTNVIVIASGGFHSCALTNEGKVYCWGDNQYSQIDSDDRPGNDKATTPRIIYDSDD